MPPPILRGAAKAGTSTFIPRAASQRTFRPGKGAAGFGVGVDHTGHARGGGLAAATVEQRQQHRGGGFVHLHDPAGHMKGRAGMSFAQES